MLSILIFTHIRDAVAAFPSGATRTRPCTAHARVYTITIIYEHIMRYYPAPVILY